MPGKFEDAPSDVEFMDNARGQWKPYRGWFGTFVENVVQGTARDLLAAAIDRLESRGIPVVFHCHDEVTIEVPVGIALRCRASWRSCSNCPTGQPDCRSAARCIRGRITSKRPSSRPCRWWRPIPTSEVLEQAIDVYVDDIRQDIGPIDDPALVEREDDEDYVANLPDHVAPLTEMVGLPLSPGNKVACPFHEDAEPSCTIYADHFHCFGCGEHGSRLDWLTRVEGMTMAEADHLHQGLALGTGARAKIGSDDDAEKLAFINSIWTSSTAAVGIDRRAVPR